MLSWERRGLTEAGRFVEPFEKELLTGEKPATVEGVLVLLSPLPRRESVLLRVSLFFRESLRRGRPRPEPVRRVDPASEGAGSGSAVLLELMRDFAFELIGFSLDDGGKKVCGPWFGTS